MDKRSSRLPRPLRVHTDSPRSPSVSPRRFSAPSRSSEPARSPSSPELQEGFGEPLLRVHGAASSSTRHHQTSTKSASQSPLAAGDSSPEVIHGESTSEDVPRRMVRTASQLSPSEEQADEKRQRIASSPQVPSPHMRVSVSCSPSPPVQSSTQLSPESEALYRGLLSDPSVRPFTVTHSPSTSYATLAGNGFTYAAAATTSPPTNTQTQTQVPTGPITSSPKVHTPTPTPTPTPTITKSYPPIVVEKLLDWVSHFRSLPFKAGVRFIPKSEKEFRITQRYLVDLSAQDSSVQWHCYSPDNERPTKIAIIGLPSCTDVEDIKSALRDHGFEPIHVRHIPGRGPRSGCVHHAVLARLEQEELARLYSINQLLWMPGLRIEAWRGRIGPAQCHRCQAFGHSSANYYRMAKCLRCAGDHLASDCPHPRKQEPKCTNCGGAHAANDRRCPVFRKEARKRGIKVPPPIPNKPSVQVDTNQSVPQVTVPSADMPEAPQGATLAPPANNPTERGQVNSRRRRPRGRRTHQPTSNEHTETAPTPVTTEVTTKPLPSSSKEAVVTLPPLSQRPNKRARVAEQPTVVPPSQPEVEPVIRGADPADKLADVLRTVLEVLSEAFQAYIRGESLASIATLILARIVVPQTTAARSL